MLRNSMDYQGRVLTKNMVKTETDNRLLAWFFCCSLLALAVASAIYGAL